MRLPTQRLQALLHDTDSSTLYAVADLVELPSFRMTLELSSFKLLFNFIFMALTLFLWLHKYMIDDILLLQFFFYFPQNFTLNLGI